MARFWLNNKSDGPAVSAALLGTLRADVLTRETNLSRGW